MFECTRKVYCVVRVTPGSVDTHFAVYETVAEAEAAHAGWYDNGRCSIASVMAPCSDDGDFEFCEFDRDAITRDLRAMFGFDLSAEELKSLNGSPDTVTFDWNFEVVAADQVVITVETNAMLTADDLDGRDSITEYAQDSGLSAARKLVKKWAKKQGREFVNVAQDTYGYRCAVLAANRGEAC